MPLVRSPIATGSGYLLSVTGYGETITGELWRSADGVAWEQQPAEATPGVVGSLLIVPGGIEATVFRIHPDPADPGSGSIGTVLGHAPDGVVWTVDADEVPAELYPPVALPNGSLLAAACNLEVMNSDDPDAMPASLWLHRGV